MVSTLGKKTCQQTLSLCLGLHSSSPHFKGHKFPKKQMQAFAGERAPLLWRGQRVPNQPGAAPVPLGRCSQLRRPPTLHLHARPLKSKSSNEFLQGLQQKRPRSSTLISGSVQRRSPAGLRGTASVQHGAATASPTRGDPLARHLPATREGASQPYALLLPCPVQLMAFCMIKLSANHVHTG